MLGWEPKSLKVTKECDSWYDKFLDQENIFDIFYSVDDCRTRKPRRQRLCEARSTM